MKRRGKKNSLPPQLPENQEENEPATPRQKPPPSESQNPSPIGQSSEFIIQQLEKDERENLHEEVNGDDVKGTPESPRGPSPGAQDTPQ